MRNLDQETAELLAVAILTAGVVAVAGYFVWRARRRFTFSPAEIGRLQFLRHLHVTGRLA